MNKNNIHTETMFQNAYGQRNWDWYKGLVGVCVEFGMPGKWLDLGAGLGLFTECAMRFGIDCIGLEGSEYAIEKAKDRFSGINMRQHFIGEKIPFGDDSISTIICNQVIEHIPHKNVYVMFKECFRVLQEDGRIFIYSPCIYDKKQRMAPAHINLYTPSRLKLELKEAGFVNIKSLDNPRMVLGNSRFAKTFSVLLFRKFPFDFLSSTANCVAIKSVKK